MKREGQRGARIDPKGCKVRTTKDAQGNKKKENKQGNEKIKRTTTNRDMRLAVVGRGGVCARHDQKEDVLGRLLY